MLGVEIRTLDENGNDVREGRILLDANKLRCEPDTPGLRRIIEQPTAGPPSDWYVVSAKSNPLVFLECLRFRYTSPYGRASVVKDFPD